MAPGRSDPRRGSTAAGNPDRPAWAVRPRLPAERWRSIDPFYKEAFRRACEEIRAQGGGADMTFAELLGRAETWASRMERPQGFRVEELRELGDLLEQQFRQAGAPGAAAEPAGERDLPGLMRLAAILLADEPAFAPLDDEAGGARAEGIIGSIANDDDSTVLPIAVRPLDDDPAFVPIDAGPGHAPALDTAAAPGDAPELAPLTDDPDFAPLDDETSRDAVDDGAWMPRSDGDRVAALGDGGVDSGGDLDDGLDEVDPGWNDPG